MSKMVHMTGLDPGEPVRLILRGGQEIVVIVEEDAVGIDLTKFFGTVTVTVSGPIEVWSADAEKGLVAQGLDPHGHPIGTYARGSGIGIRLDVSREQFAGEPAKS